MKEARLLSERASERATSLSSIALPEGGKDLFVEGSSNFGVAKKRRISKAGRLGWVGRGPTYVRRITVRLKLDQVSYPM